MRYLIVVLFVLAACGDGGKTKVVLPDSATVISEVNVVDVRDGNILEARYVIVDEGKIIQILDKAPEITEDIHVIDGKDLYLTPGLAEMHSHIPAPPVSEQEIQDVLALYAVNGVMTIRGMQGDPYHLELRQKASENEILSPRIYAASPSFNGNSVKTPEEGIEKVRQATEAGYDLLKFHPDMLKEVHDAVVETADGLGIRYAGHVSKHVGIRHALRSNYASVDHLDGMLEGLVPESAEADPFSNGFFGYAFTDLVDLSLLPEITALTQEHEVWAVPTQTLMTRWYSPKSGAEMATEPEMKYMPASTLQRWVDAKDRMISGDHYKEEQWEKFIQIREQIIHALQKEGYGLLLGSDSPQVFNVPGFSIHHEMQFLEKAGLTPLEVIRSGTVNVAEYFGREGEMGEVVEGAAADFIVSRENPLDKLETLKNPEGVMIRGKWLAKNEISEILADIAERSEKL